MRLPSDDTEINYEIAGRGPDLVLLHPFPSSHAFWAPIVERFEQRYRLVMPDLRGLGESAPGEGDATMQRHAEDLRRLCDALSIGRAIFVGCSIGGYVLFEFWRRHRERFRALVLCDTKADPDDEAARQTRERSAEDVMLRGPELFIHQSLLKLVGASTQRNRPDVFDAVRATTVKATAKGIAAVQRGMAQRPDSTPILGTINIPTLVLCGEEDVPTPLAVMQAMARQIPRAEFDVIPAAGHFAPFERPEEFARRLRQFVDALPNA